MAGKFVTSSPISRLVPCFWDGPRPAHHLTWSGTAGGCRYCCCPSPAHTLRGESIAWPALGSLSAVDLSPVSPAGAACLV